MVTEITIVCQWCDHRSEGGRAYWHTVNCENNPKRVLKWDGWKIGERGKLPNKKEKK